MANSNDALFQQAVQEHAQYLGMDLEKDKEYFHIAEEALTAPLPEGWQQGLADDGTPYHFNEETGESMWEHPMDGHYKELFQTAKAEAKAKKEAQAKEESANACTAADDMEIDEFDEDEFHFEASNVEAKTNRAAETETKDDKGLADDSDDKASAKDAEQKTPQPSPAKQTKTPAAPGTGFGKDYKSWMVDPDSPFSSDEEPDDASTLMMASMREKEAETSMASPEKSPQKPTQKSAQKAKPAPVAVRKSVTAINSLSIEPVSLATTSTSVKSTISIDPLASPVEHHVVSSFKDDSKSEQQERNNHTLTNSNSNSSAGFGRNMGGVTRPDSRTSTIAFGASSSHPSQGVGSSSSSSSSSSAGVVGGGVGGDLAAARATTNSANTIAQQEVKIRRLEDDIRNLQVTQNRKLEEAVANERERVRVMMQQQVNGEMQANLGAQRTIQSQNGQIERCKKEISALEEKAARVAALERENKELQEQMSYQVQDLGSKAGEQSQASKARIQKLTQDLDAAKMELSITEQQVAMMQQKGREHAEQQERLEAKLADMAEQAERYKAEADECRQRADAEKRRADDEARRARQAAVSSESVQEALDAEKDRADQIDQECRKLQQQAQRIHQLEVDLKLGQEQCNRLVKEKAGLSMEVGRLKMEATEFSSRLQDVQDEAKAATAALERVKTKDVADLKRANEELMRDVHELSTTVAEQKAEVLLQEQKLRSSQEEANRQMTAVKFQQQSLEERERDQKRKEAEIESRIRQKDRHIVELETTNGAIEKEMRAQAQLNAESMRTTEMERDEAQYEARRAKERADAAEAWRKREVERTQAKTMALEQAQTELEQAKAELEDAKAREMRAPSDLKRTRELLEAMEGQLAEKDAAVGAVRARLVEREGELQRLQQEFDAQTKRVKEEIDQQLPKLAAAATARAQQEWQRRCEAEVSTIRGALDEELEVQRQRDMQHNTQLAQELRTQLDLSREEAERAREEARRAAHEKQGMEAMLGKMQEQRMRAPNGDRGWSRPPLGDWTLQNNTSAVSAEANSSNIQAHSQSMSMGKGQSQMRQSQSALSLTGLDTSVHGSKHQHQSQHQQANISMGADPSVGFVGEPMERLQEQISILQASMQNMAQQQHQLQGRQRRGGSSVSMSNVSVASEQSKENSTPVALPDVASILHVRHAMPSRARAADVTAEAENVFDALHKVGGGPSRFSTSLSSATGPAPAPASTSRVGGFSPSKFSPNKSSAGINMSMNSSMNMSARSQNSSGWYSANYWLAKYQR